ncbi:MAG TPA: DotH/IcmK family type IV secretion protein [Alphaproteobacteria bacterium]|nr:DotH/IcmK family type IV secretion protein [Alphaproteobacteria bacterium]
MNRISLSVLYLLGAIVALSFVPNAALAQDAISDTFKRASDTPAEPAAAPANDAGTPPPEQNAGTLPELPTDAESLSALTEALAADQSALDMKDKKTKAFENALEGTFPLTPEQIKEVMRRMSEAQEAGRAPPAPDPRATVKVENIPLDPGVTPPMIQVAQGYVTTVNLLDITGQPWPIQDVVIGGNFTVTGPNDAHVLRIIPQTRYGRGNLSVRLVGLPTPVTFRVEAGGDEVYYRYDARVPQSGPGAKTPLISQGFTGQAGSTVLMGVLEGVAPAGAKKMEITGADGRTRAWKIDGQIYLRTPLTLLSPGWDASVRSADGTNVYMMTDAPILMLSDNGQMIRAKLKAPPEDPFRPDDLKEGNIMVPVDDAAKASGPGAGIESINPTTPPAMQPVGGQAALDAATQPPAGGSIANEAAARRGGVQIYTNGNTPQTGGNIVINNGGGS